MKRYILILALALNTTHCGKTTTKNPVANTQSKSRNVASVDGATKNTGPFSAYPSSFISFLKNETQRVKLESTLKQYAAVLPQDTYTRLLTLSKKVDDSGFSMKRKNSNLILDNGKSKFIVGFSGNLNTILATIQGQTYDFSQQKDVDTYLNGLEIKIDNDLKNQKPGASESKKGASLANSFLLQCRLLSLPFMAQDSEAIATGWFILGGMALIAVAIAIAANKMTKNLKKTEHTVNHKFGLSESSEGVIKDLTEAVKDVDVDVLSNNNVTVTPDGTTVDSSGLGIE